MNPTGHPVRGAGSRGRQPRSERVRRLRLPDDAAPELPVLPLIEESDEPELPVPDDEPVPLP